MKKIKARWMPLLRAMVRDRRLSPIERLATRVWLYGCRFLNHGTVDTYTNMFYSRVYMCNDTGSC